MKSKSFLTIFLSPFKEHLYFGQIVARKSRTRLHERIERILVQH